MARNDVHELLRSMDFDSRLTALALSVIRSRPEALASATYLVESASVLSVALSRSEKIRLVARARDIIDEVERSAMKEIQT
jgi:hypothetical protein